MGVRIEVSFVCPKCGGHMFSSYDCGTPQGMTRYCTSIRKPGLDRRSCGIEFHERDDWKYFVITVPAGIRRFKNRDEYELVMDVVRGMMGPARVIGGFA